MTILQICALIVLAGLVGRVRGGRPLAMLGVSALVVFWLQPADPRLDLHFWLPAATISITVIAWAVTSNGVMRSWRQNWSAALVLVVVVAVIEANRYLQLLPAEAVGAPRLAVFFAGIVVVAGAATILVSWQSANRFFLAALLVLIILIFIIVKSPAMTAEATGFLVALRPSTNGAVGALGAGSLGWFGYSYVAFRLLHTIRDRQSGRLPPVTLAEYLDYVIFFPAFTAGPIDRIERFVQDLRSPAPLQQPDWLEAGSRLLLGLIKKFVIADTLAVISMSDGLLQQVKTPVWLWVFLYAYAFRIYFDFSGYTDLAIGMGRLLGVRLPENFARPYLRSNIALFWNSWHMTLTQWFRAYVFNPLTRALRVAKWRPPDWVVVLTAQLSMMVLIGLWHGVAWSFVFWGLWHGLGLFVHNRWIQLSRNRFPAWAAAPAAALGLRVLGVAATFNFVALGWLFFNLSSPTVAWQTLLRLFGLA